jgi:hypothetical protein
MRHNEEDTENAERDCRDGEKIDRGKLLGMVLQKYAPGLRRRLVMSNYVFGNCCLRDIDSESEQFSVNSRCSPEGVIFAHGADELTNILGNPGPSCLTVPDISRSKTCGIPCDARTRRFLV